MSRGVWIRGRVLAELRDLAGLSQEDLAFACTHREGCKVTREEISAYEREHQRPTRTKLNAIIAVVKVSEEDKRKLIVTLTLDALDTRLGYTLQHPASVDLIAVAGLREQVHGLGVRYDRAPSTSLLAEAGLCLGQVAFLRAHASRGDVRRELYAVEAEGATLMGQLVWDASHRRDHATARIYFDQAIGAGQQLRDPTAEGLALLRKSFVALYGEKDPKAGLSLAMQTAEIANGTSHVLTGLAVAHAAEAHAMLRQRRPCEQALSLADSHFDQIGTADPAMDVFSPAQHGRLAGSCYLFLGDAKRAQRILEAAVQELRDRSKSQAIVLGNLTLSCIRQGKLDEAAVMLHKAIDVVELTRGGGGFNIIFGAGRELRSWLHIASVRDAHDRLLGLMAAA
ncbi:MAG: helix-turn-helix transcriptional regulator [Egibacteraceae bacterium]